jgi:glycosyltransferase involved in cell wall biosynthesis
MAIALLEEPRLHVEVLGGAIARYHEGGYSRFRRGLDRHLAPMERISLLDWQPYRSIPAAYARCHAALSLDRWTYEAVLGSRTRIVHMLAAGRPVVSTALSELTQDMAKSGVLVAVEAGNPRSLANGLLQLSRMNRTDLDHLSKRCRRVVEEQASAANLARAFRAWIVSPRFSADQTLSPTNALLPYWHEAIQIMTS